MLFPRSEPPTPQPTPTSSDVLPDESQLRRPEIDEQQTKSNATLERVNRALDEVRRLERVAVHRRQEHHR